jgi:hypothetical protein
MTLLNLNCETQYILLAEIIKSYDLIVDMQRYADATIHVSGGHLGPMLISLL